ncbi:hypothetical protein UPYG_G00047480, partial [Umbra pygmaea]
LKILLRSFIFNNLLLRSFIWEEFDREEVVEDVGTQKERRRMAFTDSSSLFICPPAVTEEDMRGRVREETERETEKESGCYGLGGSLSFSRSLPPSTSIPP